MNKQDYIEGIKAGDVRALSKAITLAESHLKENYELALSIVEAFTQNIDSKRIGITGTPGVGKSTFINTYGKYVLEKDPKSKIAVLSIDPSSSLSGGSILGDKTRMPFLSQDQRAFIRPSASGTNTGGLSRSTRLAILLCEAAGYNKIFIESVGVGQSETEISRLCDLFVLLLNPGGGDELQGIKRGIVEMADILLVNKADGDSLSIAQQTAKEYSNAQHLLPQTESGWIPKVLMCSAVDATGLDSFNETVEEYFNMLSEEAKKEQRNTQQSYWVYKHLIDILKGSLQERSVSIDAALKEGSLPERIALDLSKDFFI